MNQKNERITFKAAIWFANILTMKMYMTTTISKYYVFIQSKWLKLLAHKKNNICCVGDDDQSIYSWRGAEIRNFLDFSKTYKNSIIINVSLVHDPVTKHSATWAAPGLICCHSYY